MWPFVKRVPWLPAVVAALVGVAVVLGLGLQAKHSRSITRKVAPISDRIAAAVRAANEKSVAIYARRVAAWRQYLRSLRTRQRLTEFVDELTGLEQKFRQGMRLLGGGPTDEQRVLALFRRCVVDERQLVVDLQATVDEYEHFLFEQDRPVWEAAGISPEAWAAQVKTPKPESGVWGRELRGIVTRAVTESHEDGVRFVATTIAADVAGNGIKGLARALGLDQTEQGSIADSITGFAADLAADAAISHATDATEAIVSRLGREMAQAESAILDGDSGLLAALQRLKTTHETARKRLLAGKE